MGHEDVLITAQSLVVEILNRLLRAPSHKADAAIAHALARLGAFADADRVHVFHVQPDGTLVIRHEWVAPDVAPLQPVLAPLPATHFTHWMPDFNADRPVHYPDVASLPASLRDREPLLEQGVLAMLAVPMMAEGRFLGFVGFDVTRAPRVFPDHHIRLLKSAADVIATVILRAESEALIAATQAELRATSERLDATLKAMPDLVLEIDADGRYTGYHASTPENWPQATAALLGQRFEDVMPGEFAADRRRIMAEVDAAGRSEGNEILMPYCEGSRWIEINASRRAALGDDPRPGYVFVLRDISARKAAQAARAAREAELEASNARLEQALAEQHRAEGRLTAIAEISDLWFWEQDADLRFTYVSASRAPLVPAADQIGQRREELAAARGIPTDAPGWAELRAKQAAREPFENLVQALNRPGEPAVWVSLSGSPVFDAQGDFAGYRGIGSVVTDLVQREVTARATAHRFEATLNALPDLLVEFDAEGRYTGYYARSALDGGADPANYLGRLLDEVLPAEEIAAYRAAMRDVDAGLRPQPRRLSRGEGDATSWWEISAAPNAGAGEQPGYLFLIRDVTADQRQKERVLLLGKIVELMTNLVAVVDNHQRVVWVNPAFETHTGHRLDDIRGKLLAGLTRNDDTDLATMARLGAAIERGEPCRAEILNADKYGMPYWVDLNIHPLRDEAGEVMGYVSVETVITDQKRDQVARERLARAADAARARLTNALEALPDGVVIYDDADRLVTANSVFRASRPQLADVLVEGARLEDLLRLGLERGVYPDAVGQEKAWLADRLERYRRPRNIDEVLLPDGRWVRRLDMRTSDGGRISVEIDTTARRNQLVALDAANAELTRALDQRHTAEQRLGSIMEGAEVGTWEWDVASGLFTINGRWSEMLGYTREELEPMSMAALLDMLHPDDYPVVLGLRAKAFSTEPNVISAEFRLRHKNGNWVWVLSRGRVTRWSGTGRTEIVAGVHLDINDRKDLEHQIITARNFLNNVMENSISAIAVIDRQGELIFANPEAEDILGLTRSEILGLRFDAPSWHLADLDGNPLPDKDIPFRQAVDKGGPVRNVRHAIQWPDGQRRVLSVNAVPYGMDGPDGQVICSFSDITEQLEIQNRLEQALARAEEASHSKSLFLANMSHEIRTPLNGVLGMAELLDATLSEPRQKLMIRTIRNSGEVLLSILNNILDMSKIESGKFDLEKVPFNPAELARQVEAVYALKAEEKGLEFEVLTSLGCEMGRLGDPHRILQILHNLLSNAVKFTDKGGVTLKLTCRSGKPLTIEVTDTGIGMTPEQTARVFEEFEQADGSVTRRFGGTGLGMSIVRQLVKLMGGEISLESVPDRGTVARVSLPLPDAELPLAVEAALPVMNAEVRFDGCRLLIADDSATNRLVLQEMLADTGARITTVEDGQQALEAWRSGAFDLLLLDISMPVMDGLTALKNIRAEESQSGRPPVPAIAVTANAMAHQVADYIIGGFDSHLSKPFRRQELLHAIVTLTQ
ncbi:PAS domain-containing protein [Fertoebacter nigrum]|uniref:histidine kinase n=1 Tax=Fertoeibacter niger TaxID=2656921 RepID=A0A8X8GUZ4_9RHOB|nr:PAS domain-containing protein [Fertoeibacter niger]NUB44823.1 PAS domain-containing protein [Fertoeibacter niger]